MALPELTDQSFTEILSSIAADSPTPGGGAAAAASAALAAAILQMVAAATLKRRRYEDGWPIAREAEAALPDLRTQLERAMAEDVVAYQQVVVLLSYQNEGNSTTTVQALEDALTGAAQVPLNVARCGGELVRLGRGLVEQGNVHAAADAAAACQIAAAAVRASVTNVHVNLREISNKKLQKSWLNQADRLREEVDRLTAGLHAVVLTRLSIPPKKGRRRRSHA